MNIRIPLVAGLLAITASLGLAQTTITFDDLNPGTETTSIPNGYQGLNWSSNIASINPLTYTGEDLSGTGYANGTISSPTIAWVFPSSAATISPAGGGTFDVLSGYFTAAWPNFLPVTLHAEGFLGGISVFSLDTKLDNTQPQFVTLGFTSIDQLALSIPGGESGFGYQFAMDNLKVTAIPEPSTYAVIFGLGFLALALWRRQRR